MTKPTMLPIVEEPEADEDNWIEWSGDAPPVEYSAEVEVIDRDGTIDDGRADDFDWDHIGAGDDIVGYRPVGEPAVVARTVPAANDNYNHAAAINLFAADCHAASRRAGWYTDLETGKAKDRNVGEMLMLIVSEIAEAMEGERKGLMDDKLTDRPMGEVELADAMIRIGDLATYRGYDLGGAVVAKMAYNATRLDHKVEARKAAGGKAF